MRYVPRPVATLPLKPRTARLLMLIALLLRDRRVVG